MRYSIPVVLILALAGCTRQPQVTVDWAKFAAPVSAEMSQKVLNKIPKPYFEHSQEYDYFALRFLKPLSNKQMPVVLETTCARENWVRVFTLRDENLIFVAESMGRVSRADADVQTGTVTFVVTDPYRGKTSSIVLIDGGAS